MPVKTDRRIQKQSPASYRACQTFTKEKYQRNNRKRTRRTGRHQPFYFLSSLFRYLQYAFFDRGRIIGRNPTDHSQSPGKPF